MSDDKGTGPFTMLETAIGIHEIFTSYIRAGFTREEALELVKVSMGSQS